MQVVYLTPHLFEHDPGPNIYKEQCLILEEEDVGYANLLPLAEILANVVICFLWISKPFTDSPVQCEWPEPFRWPVP